MCQEGEKQDAPAPRWAGIPTPPELQLHEMSWNDWLKKNSTKCCPDRLEGPLSNGSALRWAFKATSPAIHFWQDCENSDSSPQPWSELFG